MSPLTLKLCRLKHIEKTMSPMEPGVNLKEKGRKQSSHMLEHLNEGIISDEMKRHICDLYPHCFHSQSGVAAKMEQKKEEYILACNEFAFAV